MNFQYEYLMQCFSRRAIWLVASSVLNTCVSAMLYCWLAELNHVAANFGVITYYALNINVFYILRVNYSNW